MNKQTEIRQAMQNIIDGVKLSVCFYCRNNTQNTDATQRQRCFTFFSRDYI